MELPLVNTRADLDALAGTPAHDTFMTLLAGTLWRLTRDDVEQTWRIVEDDSTVARFGFSRADFPDAEPPELPEYVPLVQPVPQVVTMRQARLALLGAGLLARVNDALAAMPGVEGEAARIEWEYATTVDRGSPLIASLGGALGLDDAALDDLFTTADKIV